MTDPIVLSSSSLATFLRCGLQWKFAYVDGVKSPPSVRQVIGIAAHRAIELDMEQKVTSKVDLPRDVVLDAFNDSFDEEIYGYEVDEGEETPEKGKDSGRKVVDLAHSKVLPQIQPVLVEQQVQIGLKYPDLDHSIPYSGYIDLVDDLGRVHDWKTTKRRPTNTPGLQILQMTGYALGYRVLTGETESEVVLNHFIRTQVPSHLPVASGGPVEQPAINAFARIVLDVYLQIQAGRFLPNGLMSGACSWCGYTAICPAYKEFRNA